MLEKVINGLKQNSMEFRKGDIITVEGKKYMVVYSTKDYPNIVDVKFIEISND